MGTFGIESSISSWYGLLIMSLLAGLSIYMFALIIRQFRFYSYIKVDSQKLLKELQEAVGKNDAKALNEFKGHTPSDPPVRILVSTAVENKELEDSELSELLKITQVRQRERLERGISVFGTCANIGTLLGLFATVLGIIDSFQNLAKSGAAGPNVVSAGVAEALWGTAAGLCLAIPAYVAVNYFRNRARRSGAEMEITARELMFVFKLAKKHKRAA